MNCVVPLPPSAEVEDSSALSLAQRALTTAPLSFKPAAPLMLVSQKS